MSSVKEIIQSFPSPTTPLSPPDKILLRLWNKNFLTEIYRNIQTFAFKVLEECCDTKQKHIWWKILKAERFFLCCGSILFSMLRFVKCVRFSQRNCIVKWVIFFASCCWFWNFLLEKNMMSTGTCGRIWKKLYDQNNTFKTRIPNMRFWIIYILVQILFWGGLF